ncbi:MAG: hypothetical protein ABJA74_13410 [Lapillicoccus sp.]
MSDAFPGRDGWVVELDHALEAREPRLPGPQQDRHQVDRDAVKQPQLEKLARDVRAGDGNGALDSHLLGLLDGAADPVENERERGVRVRPIGRRLVGDDEYWRPRGVTTTPNRA